MIKKYVEQSCDQSSIGKTLQKAAPPDFWALVGCKFHWIMPPAAPFEWARYAISDEEVTMLLLHPS